MAEDILYEVRNGAAWVTLNRPDALNSMNQTILDAYADLVQRAEDDPEVHALVFTGTGRAFSAGADLKYVLQFIGDGDPVKVRTFMKQAYAAFARVGTCEKPTIAAVNGVTAAGGLELLLACDLVIAAESVKIGDGHINFGMLPGGGSSIRLPRKIGETRARYLLLTGELLPVTEIADWGLVNEIVPDEQLIPRTEALVARLTSKSPAGHASDETSGRSGPRHAAGSGASDRNAGLGELWPVQRSGRGTDRFQRETDASIHGPLTGFRPPPGLKIFGHLMYTAAIHLHAARYPCANASFDYYLLLMRRNR